MSGQKKRKFTEDGMNEPSRRFEYQNDEPENQTSGTTFNANIFNTKNYLKAKTKKNLLLFRFDRCKKEKLPVLR